MSSSKTAAPTDSAPNKDTAAREKVWRAEIHTPAAEYNANVPCDAIEPDPQNRDKISKERVANMAASIKAVGLLQPIVLRALDGGKYRIIAGEHRWRAHLELKLKTIAARIYKNQSDLDAAKKKAVENAQRTDLTPIERATRFKELTELGENQKSIGALFGGLSQPVVANALRLLDLPPAVQELISKGELSEAHGVALVRWAKFPRVCLFIAESAITDRTSSKDLNQRELPFSYYLKEEGLVTEINTGSHYSGRMYVLPDEFKNDPAFVRFHSTTYYLHPEDPKENKWLPLKAKLDAAMDAKEAAAAERESKKGGKASGDGKPSKEALERKKKIAENKQARTEATIARQVMLDQLAKTKELDASSLVVVAKAAFESHWNIGRGASEVAEKLGISLPKGFAPSSLKWLAKLKPVDLLRLCAGAIADDECESGSKFAWGVESLEDTAQILGAKKSAAVEQSATALIASAAKAKADAKKGAK